MEFASTLSTIWSIISDDYRTCQSEVTSTQTFSVFQKTTSVTDFNFPAENISISSQSLSNQYSRDKKILSYVVDALSVHKKLSREMLY